MIVGKLIGGGLMLEEVYRFANTPVSLPDGLHWNTLSLYEEILAGLLQGGGDPRTARWDRDRHLGRRLRAARRQPASARDPVSLPRHPNRGDDRARVQWSRRDQRYARTGIQTMPINTVFQLLAERDCARAPGRRAHRPDPRSARAVADRHACQRGDDRLHDRVARREDRRTGLATWLAAHGIPTADLRGATRSSRAPPSGPCTPDIEELAGLPVWNVAAHDTASAFVAAPVASPNSAILSSGTWSLLGVEVDAPVLDGGCRGFQPDQRARDRRLDPAAAKRHGALADAGVPAALVAARASSSITQSSNGWRAPRATATRCSIPTIRICCARATCRRGSHACARTAGEQAPQDPGQFVRAILTSLACKYNFVLRRLELVTGRRFETIHVIGGGTRNRVLCQLTADIDRIAGRRRSDRGNRARQHPRAGACSRAPRLTLPDTSGRRRRLLSARALRALRRQPRRRDLRALPRESPDSISHPRNRPSHRI